MYNLLNLPVLWFFKDEIFNFVVSLTRFQWILIITVSCICISFARAKIEQFITSSIEKLRYYSLKEYKRKFITSIQEKDADEMGNALANWLENAIFLNLGCTFLSIVIFRHYPLKFLKIGAIAFIFTLIAYFFVSLAFKKRRLADSIIILSSCAFGLYPLAFISHYTGFNLFETFLIEFTDFSNINAYNLTETANKLFMLVAPYCATMIIFLILSAIVTRKLLTSLFNKLQQAL